MGRSSRFRRVTRLVGECGDWVCLPKRLAPDWGGTRQKDVLPGPCMRTDEDSDYGHFIEALGVGMEPVRLHGAQEAPVIQISGYQASLFRRSLQRLFLHRHDDALNHDYEHVDRMTGRLPVGAEVAPPQARHQFHNRDAAWVIFFGMARWAVLHRRAFGYMGLTLPLGAVALTVSEVAFEPEDPKRRVLALRFEGAVSGAARPRS